MFKIATLLLLMACIDYAAYPQDSSANLFRDASHCLVTEKQDWLAVRNTHTKVLELGYLIDPKSDPGVNHIYVVVYASAERSKGRVFDLRYQENANGTLFDVQNNASFEITEKAIKFIDPPLGGTWTQAHLQSAIRLAGRKTSIKLSIADLMAPYPGVSCRSYVESR